MAKNRTIEQKILKIKRRNRHAVFSGETTKYVDKEGPIPFTEDVYGNTKTGKAKRILVGEVSLSKAVINTGRGPDAVRMQEYYQRIHSYDEALPKTLGFTGPMKEMMDNYSRIVKETPREMRIRLVDNHTGTLDLFFESYSHQFFFVDVDYKKKLIRRSKIYASKKFAMRMLELKAITWVEQLPK